MRTSLTEETNLAVATGDPAAEDFLPPGGRILIVEECLCDDAGHFANLVRALTEELARSGAETEVWAHRKLPPESVPAAHTVRPVFDQKWFDRLFATPRWRRPLVVLEHNLRFFLTLWRTGAGQPPWQCVIASSANLFHLLAWRLWLATGRISGRLVIVMLRPPWFFEYRADGRMQFKFQAIFYRWMFLCFASAVRSGRCRFCAETEHDARILAGISGLDFRQVPIPRPETVLASTEAPAPWRPGKPLRLGFLGNATTDKGFDVLLAALTEWVRQTPAGECTVKFVVQWKESLNSMPGWRETLDVLAHTAPAAIEVIEGAVPEPAYARLLGSLHGVLLPYRRTDYIGRGSSVAMDAFCGGRPVVCTKGTWIAEMMPRWGSGVTCADQDTGSLVAAIRQLTSGYAGFSAQARQTMPRARRDNSWARFSSEIAGPQPTL